MTPEQIAPIVTVVTGLIAVVVAGLKAFWNAYQAQIAARMTDKDAQQAARMADKDAQIADLKVQRDQAIAALRDGNSGLELNADATDRLGKVVDKLVRGAKVKAP